MIVRICVVNKRANKAEKARVLKDLPIPPEAQVVWEKIKFNSYMLPEHVMSAAEGLRLGSTDYIVDLANQVSGLTVVGYQMHWGGRIRGEGRTHLPLLVQFGERVYETQPHVLEHARSLANAALSKEQVASSPSS